MSEDKWFHGHISRQKAEELLQNSGIDGSFVVRSSESIAGAYALSVLFNKTVHTYRVLPTDSGLLAVQTLNGVQQRKFKSISELVFEYRNPQNGLIYALTNPVGQATPKLPAFDPITTPVRKDPLPKPPGAAVPPTNRLIQMGVKVIPTDTTKAATATPTDKGRDLPPVPNSREIPPSRVPPSKPTEVKSKESELQTKFVERLNDLKNNYPTVGSGYFDSVQQYASDRGLLADLATIKRGGGQCAELQTLLAKEAVAFQSELERFLTKIDLLRQLFDFGSPPRKNNVYNRTGKDVDLDTFLGRLGDCQTVVKSLNKRACIKLQELMGLGSASPQVSLPRKQSRNIVPLTDRLFEVKQEGALKYAKHRLKVDVVSGKLTVFKGDGTSNEYDHTQVLQIVKNNKSKTKLLIVLEGNKKREYSFEQSALREAFCQLLQHVRNKHSKSSEPDCVSLFCGTWNMGDAIPPNDISSWFMCQGSGRTLDDMVNSIPHDIYVLGTQETGPPEKEWMHKCMDTVQDITGKSFHLVAMDALWHIKILVFVKEEHKNRISHVKTSSVKTGIANALGNKGAVGVSFQFGGTSFCFINAHLTSGAEKCIRRNNNYYDIMRSLNLGEDRFRDFDLSNRFDHLYFLGDLNYRLEMEVQEILAYLKRGDYGTLAKVDQLRREKDSCKVFSGFDEEEIAFPPTYRYERGTRETYSHLKVKKTGVRINVPSWCDRVLWRSYPETHSICLSYGCSDDIMTSDHSPVFANFQVGVRGQYVSNAGISSHPDNAANTSSISFENVEVILKSPGKSSFYLQFHSVCLTKYVRSKRNSRFDTSDLGPNYVRLGWSKEHVEQLKPIISDREYLVDQHILVSVRSEDDHEIHAECVLALRSMIGTDPQMFEERLTRKGDDIGQIRGRMLVKARGESQRVKEKTYDFIQFGGIKEEDGKKSHMIEEAPMYGDINDTAAVAAQATARITLKSNFRPREHSPAEAMFSPEVAVYGETPTAPEGEYADPEQLSPAPQMVTSPVFPIAERQSPSSMVPTFYSSAQHVSEVPRRKQPSPAPAPAQLEEPLSALPRQQAVNRPPPNPRGSPVIMAPVARQPQPPPSQHTPMTKAARPPSDHSAMFDNALAEFAEIESWIRSAPDTGGNGSSNFHSPGLYDVPSNLPQKTHLDLTSNPPTAGQNAAKTRMQMPTAAATQKARPVSEGPKIPSSVSGFLADLQLEHYAPLLHESGWDSIEFLSDMTEDDLMDAGVTSAQHRHLILEQIHLLAL